MNAKELVLSKLNAGRNMIGMYIYGISIGMDFTNISDLLKSLTGRTITETIQGNYLQRVRGTGRDAERAFEYFYKGPINRLEAFNVFFDRNSEFKSNQTPLSFLYSIILQDPEYLIYIKNNDNKDENILLSWIKAYSQHTDSVNTLLNIVNGLRKKYNSLLKEDNITYNRLLDFVEEYIIQYNSLDLGLLRELHWLSRGAEEMRLFGSIVGLNLGLPTLFDSIINKIEEIETLLSETNPVNIMDIAFADEETRLRYIEEYDKKKHTYNLVHAIYTLPHVLKYVLLLALEDFVMKKLSYKYRSVRNSLYKAKSSYRIFSNKDAVSGLTKYLGDETILQWLKSKNIQFTLPVDSLFFTPDGKLVDPINTVKTITLGTIADNGTFRLWMEEQVIPDLKLGKLGNRTPSSEIKLNTFILGLEKKVNTKTISKNGTDVYTLDINMLPRTLLEKDLLKTYIDSFNTLDNYLYYDASGKSFSVKDLLTLYTLIAHEGRVGESSLMPILRESTNLSLLLSFRKYEADLDKSDKVLTNLPLDLRYYLTSKQGLAGNSVYAWGYDESRDAFVLKQKSNKIYETYQVLPNPQYLTIPRVNNINIFKQVYDKNDILLGVPVSLIRYDNPNSKPTTIVEYNYTVDDVNHSVRKEVLKDIDIRQFMIFDPESGNFKGYINDLKYILREELNQTQSC